MSNQGTDCFLELLEKAASGSDMTENQRNLIDFLKARREINQIAPGSASFDVIEMRDLILTFERLLEYLFTAFAFEVGNRNTEPVKRLGG